MDAYQGLSTKPVGLHQLLVSNGSNKLFTQDELQSLAKARDGQELMTITQELMNHHLLTLLQESGKLLFKAVPTAEAAKMKTMSADEAMVYTYIANAGREGIWTKTIKQKTNLHNEVVRKCIKSLESQHFIKQIKSVKYSTRKIYMLASLQPSVEVTGGPWFTDKELDSEFVNGLLEVIWRYTVSFTFPSAFDDAASKATQETQLISYNQYPTVNQIHKFVEDSGVCNIPLTAANIRSLCEVLVYDDRVERSDGGYAYKATWQSILKSGGGGFNIDDQTLASIEANAWMETPCGKCPKFSLCEPKGPVNGDECVYYDEWLSFTS